MENEAYWNGRAAADDAILTQAWNDAENMRGAYEGAADSIEAELARLAKKGQLSRSEAYRLGQMQQLSAKIRTATGSASQAAALISKEAIQKAYQSAGVASYGDMVGWAALHTMQVSFAQPDPALFQRVWDAKWQGGNFSSRLWKNTGALETALNDVLTAGLRRGDSVEDMASGIESAMHTGYSNALRLTRTEAAYYVSDARIREYKDCGVTKVEWYTTEDERRCPVCGERHGKRFPISKAPPLPAHPNCRCCWIPVIETAEGLTGAEPGGTLYDTEELSHIPVTQETIDKVPFVQIGELTPEACRKIQDAEKELLKTVMSLELGTETATLCDVDGNVLWSGTGEAGDNKVRIPVPHTPYIVLHNHASGEIFSPEDISGFIFSEEQEAMLVVGNNAHVYAISKASNFDGMQAYTAALLMKPRLLSFEQDKNIQGQLELVRQLLSEGKTYGLEFDEGAAVDVGK